MNPSQACSDLIRASEGCRLTAYKDPVGIWTIGWGCTGAGIVEGTVWTQEQADVELERRITHLATQIEACVTVPLTQGQFDALVDFAYNFGIGRLRGSTLLRVLNMGLHEQVPGELARWNKAGGEVLPGLVKRRAAEVELWNKS